RAEGREYAGRDDGGDGIGGVVPGVGEFEDQGEGDDCGEEKEGHRLNPACVEITLRSFDCAAQPFRRSEMGGKSSGRAGEADAENEERFLAALGMTDDGRGITRAAVGMTEATVRMTDVAV